MSPTLSAIHIYPLKSAGGIPLERSDVDPFGPRYDRRWMITDEEGVFLSQRTVPRMALLSTAIAGSTLVLTAGGMTPLALPLEPAGGPRERVRIWSDRVWATRCGSDSDAWASEFLRRTVHVVRMPDDARREVDRRYAEPADRTAFTDGFPFLLTSEASLEDLNGRMARPLPMNRFRPNLVVRDAVPFAEDGWSRITIGALGFRVASPCARCVVTTTDQQTAERGQEPLRTLATFRRRNGKVLFGQNLVHDWPGVLERGMPVQVIEARAGR